MYHVYYHSTGCLPEGEPDTFDTLRGAARHVFDELQDRRGELLSEGIHSFGMRCEDIRDVMGAADPAPNSLYRWTIEQVSE